MKKILLFLLLGLFLVSTVSALDFDNVLQYDDNPLPYGEITVVNTFGLGADLIKATINENGCDFEGRYCQAILPIELYQEGELIEERRFYRMYEDGTQEESNIRWSKLEYWGEVLEYETQCEEGLAENGTFYSYCESVQVGSHEGWVSFTEKQEFEEGSYLVKISGEKKPSWAYDWQIKIKGEWTEPWAVWNFSLNPEILLAYDLDETSGTVIDYSSNGHDGENHLASTSISGVVNTAYSFNGVNNYINISSLTDYPDGKSEITMNLWVSFTEEQVNKNLMGWWYNYPNNLFSSTDEVLFRLRNDTSIYTLSSGTINDGDWHHLVGTWNGTNMSFYVDGVLKDSIILLGTLKSQGENLGIGALITPTNTVSNLFRGAIDIPIILEKGITQSDVEYLYNGGNGVQYPFENMEITLNYPANGSTFYSNPVTFNVNATSIGGANIVNLSLWTNETGSWEMVETINYSGGGSGGGAYNDSLNPVTYLNFEEGSGNPVDNTGNFTFIADNITYSQEGIIGNAFNFSTTGVINGSYIYSDSNLGITDYPFSFNAWIKTNLTQISEAGIISISRYMSPNYDAYAMIINQAGSFKVLRSEYGGSLDSSTFVPSTVLNNGSWIMTTAVFESANSLKMYLNGVSVLNDTSTVDFSGNANQTAIGSVNTGKNIPSSSGIFNGTIDEASIYKKDLSINDIKTLYAYGLAGLGSNSSYDNTSFQRSIYNDIIWNAQPCDSDGDCIFSTNNYSLYFDNDPPEINIITLNGTIDFLEINKPLNLSVNITDKNLDSCWYNYNGTNNSFSCTSGIIANETIFQELNNFNLTVYANDSSGNNADLYSSWGYKLFENNKSYSNETIEGSLENFNYNFSKGLEISTINLIYNGINYSSTFIDYGNYILTNNSITMPDVLITSNLSLYWSITFSDSSVVNSTTFYQQVSPLGIDDCSVYTNLIYNYTLVNERTQAIITNVTGENASIELDLQIYDLNRENTIVNLSKNYGKVNNAKVCLNLALNNNEYSLDSIVKYSAYPKYAIEYYNINNFTLKNSSAPQHIKLYDLLSAESTTFQITFKDSTFSPIEDALIQINRQYVSEGIFKTVEIPKTDANGQTVAHFVESDIVYNLIVTKQGQVLATFNNIIAFCEDITIGDCKINLNDFGATEEVWNYDDEIGLTYVFDYNSTSRTVTFQYTTTDGGVKNVTVKVKALDYLGNTTACDSELVSSAGTVYCVIPDTIGNSTAFANIFVNNELKLMFMVDLKDSVDYGTAGYFLFFFLILSLPLMFSSSKTGMIIGLIIGLIASFSLGLVKGGGLGIMASIMWVVIAGLILIWKLNKGGIT